MDLDKFKEVNDSLGHHTGDLLLVQVGARLRETLRADDVLARLGGDEFAALLEDAGHNEATDVATKLAAALAESFVLDGVTLHSSMSIGIALFPDDGADLSALLRKADIAMYRAKTSGGGHHVYCSADDAEDTTRLQKVEELQTALTDGQFVVHYQPMIDLDTGDVHAVEALVRWNHPTRGLLYPDAFLHLVEESGLMPTLTRVVLALALDQVTTWPTASAYAWSPKASRPTPPTPSSCAWAATRPRATTCPGPSPPPSSTTGCAAGTLLSSSLISPNCCPPQSSDRDRPGCDPGGSTTPVSRGASRNLSGEHARPAAARP